MMKKFFLLTYCFLLCFLIFPKCQVSQKVDSCFTIFKIALQEYKIDNCLFELLKDITESDSLNLTYPPSKYFYELTFTTNEVDKELAIIPSRWSKSKHFDYTGIIILNRMSFLCRGIAIKHDKLFIETKSTVEITLKKPKIYQNDSIDMRIEYFIKHPVLSGSYKQCDGFDINVFIYTGKIMEGYETK